MVIGISGVSRSGKTSLAYRIKQLCDGNTEIISLDDFVKPREQISRIKEHINWEIPDAHDFDELLEAINDSKKNYDHSIVEGILIYHSEKINAFFDKKLFLEISKRLFVERKKVDDRWGIEPDWYIEHIWTSHLKFGLVSTEDCIKISGNDPISDKLLSSHLFE